MSHEGFYAGLKACSIGYSGIHMKVCECTVQNSLLSVKKENVLRDLIIIIIILRLRYLWLVSTIHFYLPIYRLFEKKELFNYWIFLCNCGESKVSFHISSEPKKVRPFDPYWLDLNFSIIFKKIMDSRIRVRLNPGEWLNKLGVCKEQRTKKNKIYLVHPLDPYGLDLDFSIICKKIIGIRIWYYMQKLFIFRCALYVRYFSIL